MMSRRAAKAVAVDFGQGAGSGMMASSRAMIISARSVSRAGQKASALRHPFVRGYFLSVR